MLRPLVLVLLFSAACGSSPSLSISGSRTAIATRTLGMGTLAWCTKEGLRPYNSNAGFDAQGNPTQCERLARLVDLFVTTDDAAALEVVGAHADPTRGGTFTFRALAAGKAVLHLDARFEEGAWTEDVEVISRDAAKATRVCRVAGTGEQSSACDGADLSVPTGTTVDVGYQDLRDAEGTELDGSLELAATGAVAYSAMHTVLSVKTGGRGAVTVKTRDPVLEPLFPQFVFEVR